LIYGLLDTPGGGVPSEELGVLSESDALDVAVAELESVELDVLLEELAESVELPVPLE
jgi:hypothetical protein